MVDPRIDALDAEFHNHVRAGCFTRAEHTIRKIIALDSRLVDAWHNLMLIFHRIGAEEEFEAVYRTILSLDPGSIDHKSALADHLDIIGKTQDAAKIYQEILQSDPQHLATLLNYGGMMKHQGKAREAEQLFRCAVQAHPGEPEAHFKLAMTLMDLGHYRVAFDSFQKACLLAPDFPIFAYALNSARAVLRGQLDWESINRQAQKQEKPRHQTCWIEHLPPGGSPPGIAIFAAGKNPGPFCGMKGKVDLIPPINRYSTSVPRKARSGTEEGITLASQDNLKEAEFVFQRLTGEFPDDREVKHNLALNFLQQVKFPEALKLLNTDFADTEKGYGRLSILLGHVFYEQGHHELGERYYMDALFRFRTIDRYGAINLNEYFNERHQH